MITSNPSPSDEDIQREKELRLKKYEHTSFLERFGMYMGGAQILELYLKRYIVQNLDKTDDEVENYALGRCIKELEKSGLRPDLIELLDTSRKNRNYIAHNMLADDSLMYSFTGLTTTQNDRFLWRAISELEYLLIAVEWTEENKAWMPIDDPTPDS